MAGMKKGSYIVIENPTGLFGEWLESEAEDAGDQLNMTEGFENKWAEKHEIKKTFKTADGNDVVIFTGHSYHTSPKGKMKGISLNSKPLYIYLGGEQYSTSEMINDLNSNPGAPSILVFLSCSSMDFARTISLKTKVKVVIGTEASIRNSGSLRESTKLLVSKMRLDGSILRVIQEYNKARGALPKLIFAEENENILKSIRQLINEK
jgi:hypothetical protein